MRFRSYKTKWRRTLIFMLGIPAVLYFVWTSGHVVIAFQQEKRAHVFPTEVTSGGWENANSAITQDLPAEAPFASFTKDNSAYISIQGAHSIPIPKSGVGGVVPTHEGEVSIPPASQDATPPSLETSLSTSTTNDGLAPTQGQKNTDNAAQGTPTEQQAPLDLPTVPDSSQNEPASMIQKILPVAISTIKNSASFLFSQIVATAFATTTGAGDDQTTDHVVNLNPSSTPATIGFDTVATTTLSEVSKQIDAPVPDVATCTVLSKECHTIEFSGFDVAGSLTDKKLKGVELNFSFASLTSENQVTDGKLLVRYYHKGAWRSAGEIYLNKELSNAANGGYFSNVLTDLNVWDDLSDVRVVMEYVQGDDNASAQLYLDSVWLDAIYRERVQNVISGNIVDIPAGTPENVAFSLGDGNVPPASLVTEDGQTIFFPYVDNLDNTLTMRADRSSYIAIPDPETHKGASSVVYVSVSNSGGQDDSFRLLGAFDSGKGQISEVSQFFRNVASTTETPVYDDVTFLCENGWQKNATSTKGYTCSPTGETHECSWINESGNNCLVRDVKVATDKAVNYESSWVRSGINATIDNPANSVLPDGYSISSVSDQSFKILPGQTLYFRIVLSAKKPGPQQFILLAQGEKLSGSLDSQNLTDQATYGAKKDVRANLIKHVNDRISRRTQFQGDELPAFKFKFKTQRGPLMQMMRSLLGRSNSSFTFKDAHIRSEEGDREKIPVDVEYGKNGDWTLSFKKHPNAFRPGKYSIDLAVTEGSQTYTDTYEFYWGVLAVNTDRSIYTPGERAWLQMAALDDDGSTICDANLQLIVTDPNGSSQTLPVKQSGKCGANNVTDVPDYSADYQTSIAGTYQISLTQVDDRGQVMHYIDDSFAVRDEVLFDVQRSGPTRIYPRAPYTMEFTIKANKNFSGVVTETVPNGFVFLDKGGSTLQQYSDAMHLTWSLTLKAGEEKHLHYTFDAPDISPYTYILGPLTMKEGKRSRFQEARTWKIASDALGTYTETDFTITPTVASIWQTWDLSGSPYNIPASSTIEVAIENNSANALTAGVRSGVTVNRVFAIGRTRGTGYNAFVMHVQTTATSSFQTWTTLTANTTFRVIGYWTSGVYVERADNIDPNITDATWGTIQLSSFGVGNGNVAEMALANYNDNTVRTGGVRAASSTLERKIPLSDRTTNGGNPTYATAFVTASTSLAKIEGYAQVEGANAADNDYFLLGYWSTLPTGLSYTEKFVSLGEPSTASTWENKNLDTYGAGKKAIPEILMGNQVITSSSVDIGARKPASSDARTFTLHQPQAQGNTWGRMMVNTDGTASSTFAWYVSNTTNATTTLFGWWAPSNYSPDAPTLYSTPFDNEKTGSSTPYFLFSAVDPDGTSDIAYEIQWDDDSILDDAPLGDRLSSDESGCSPNCFTDVTSGDTSPFTEGDKIKFDIQGALVSGTTYYWRVRAKDVTGSNIDGDWSDVQSFTYIANTSPKQWYQTQDAQFDTGTLSSVQTTGADSVELVTTAPTEALTAYGEGIIQTPRYRLWDGAAWGSELSAQSVGGTIQWVVTKAGKTRNEYILGTQDSTGLVKAQVYDGVGSTWGNLQSMGTAAATANRSFDVAYETTSGDALAVYCNGVDASYYVWNGTTWTGPSAINLSSANNCDWIKLASDPTSDEIILVTRDTVAGATDYEAQVWDGNAWGNSTTLGGLPVAQTNNEGIAVEYEESGDQAIVAVSDNGANDIRWTAWNGSSWSTPAVQAIGNDFEWGVIKRDVGSDNMALCYIDLNSDNGFIRWDGGAWSAANTYEASGNSNLGRDTTCEFETTTGRDGYLMIPYSDTTNSRYRYWDGATLAPEASISTVSDSWWIGSARTGNGNILGLFWDDATPHYDFSYWDGVSWSANQTFETSPSVTATPFRQPLDLVARTYQSSSGTITGDAVTFTDVPGRSTWGEALWNTTEVSGTDVKMQVLYATSTATCYSTALVAEGVGGLTGNSAGFDVTSSPLDLTGLSTSTYPKLCLRATLSSTNTSVPTLNDWTISWSRQPYLTQESYRWYVNTSSSLTPTDLWPSGGVDLTENEAIPQLYSPYPGQVLRLRMSVLDSNIAESSSNLSLRLQYAAGPTCSASMTWFDVGAIGSTTAAWRGSDNTSLSDGATLPSTLVTTADTVETYEEQNDSSLNPNPIAIGNEGEWDWSIEHNASEGTNYCFRVITSQNQVLNAYDQYPSLLTNSKPTAPTQSIPFDNEQMASTSPYFEFSAQDSESNPITYEVQIDDNYDFNSLTIDHDSQNNDTEFENIADGSDKDPFTSEQTVRFIPPPSTLVNGTTYYWRVRGKDRTASAAWGDWSSIESFTVNTATTISTWYQTMYDQFNTDDFDQAEATTTPTNEVLLTPPNTSGTSTATSIDFDWHTTGNAWGSLSWNDTEALGTLTYHLEFWDGSNWALIPDADLSGNHAGYGTSPISIAALDSSTYNLIRPRANLVFTTGTPHLLDWTVSWSTGISQATSTALFDNEKTGTSTPTFKFSTIDPQGDDLTYEISWSASTTFAASTTINSATASTSFAFFDLSSTTDASPFASGNIIQFTIPTTSALTNNTTYWWRVRARDSNTSNINSVWSDLKSFTYDSTVASSTWFQTTDDQFNTDTLSDTETSGSNSARVSTVNREAFTAYAEGTVQTPKFRMWNGTTWDSETTGISVGDSIRFVEAAPAPTRDEYMVVTEGSLGKIYAQMYNGVTDAASSTSFKMMGTSTNALRRGFDVAYETLSGDALVVTCDGSEASYHIWNGQTWSATSSITLFTSGNCEWIQLASNPTSDEILMVVRDTTAGSIDYEALVWNGTTNTWGNQRALGSQVTSADEGMAVEYEESGGDGMVITANGANNSFFAMNWNGSSWVATSTVVIGNDLAGGRLVRDVGSDKLGFCYIDIDNDMGFVEWTGSAWGVFNEFETAANNFNGRPVACQYETTSARDGFVMIPYSSDTAVRYVSWNGSAFSTAADLSTITDSWEVRSARTGDNNILTMAYDDANTEYDFSYWNGTTWSTEQVLNSTSIPTVSPATVPFDIVARRFQTITSGTVTSPSIVFTDGLGPKWGAVSWNDTTPGSSDILYQVQYYNAGTWTPVPDAAIPRNTTLGGATTSPIDLTNVDYSTYGTLRLVANLSCSGANCPTLNDWTVTWGQGVHATGTAKQFDQTTNVVSGSVAIAVNGVKQIGKTATISAGTWDIPNVTAFSGDVITVYIDGASDANEAVAVTKYDGTGNIGGMKLYERHLSLGSLDNPTITNIDLSKYDNSVSGDEDIFYDVDAGNDLSVCRSTVTGCYDTRLLISSGTTYRPDSASSGSVTGRNVQIDGTLIADSNTLTFSGSWRNNGAFTANSSTVIFSATSTTETIDSTAASSTATAFYVVTFGSGASTARWNLLTPLNASSTLSINNGTLAPGATSTLFLDGDLTIGASGLFQKNATTTFIGTGTNTWTDSSLPKQDMGRVVIDGSTKTVTLGSNASSTDITIGANDTFSLNGSNKLTVFGNWTNNNLFTAGTGMVVFAATTSGKLITPGTSPFYDITFNGGGGNWSFTSTNATSTNNFTITSGTVTLTTGTTTVGGSFLNTGTTGGVFQHNNGTLLLNATASGKNIQVSTSTLRNLTFNGSGGGWTFLDASATTTNNFIINAGTVVAPSLTLDVGGSYTNTGTFTQNSGALRMVSTVAGKTIAPGASSFYDLIFNGSTGTWTFIDTYATTTRNFTILAGTTTMPSGIFAVGGSLVVNNGTGGFLSNTGTVKFNATTTGFSITAASSTFYDLLFDATSGGWTITGSATSTHNTTIANASSLTLTSGKSLEVQGIFTNSVLNAATTWTGTTLYLNASSTYSINTKANGGDAYATLLTGSTTKVSMWNSSATTVTTSGSYSYVYSQDNAAIDGDLFVWENYSRTTGSDYWSATTDFDGTTLTGSQPRRVNVKIATSSTLSFTGGSTLNIVGTSTATTTVINQGVGAFSWNMIGAIINAQYYSVGSTTAAGLSLLGTTTVTSLANGEFILSASSTAITVASTVIDQNPALQIQQVRFATSTGLVSGGTNVAESPGNSSSYWWFRNHYGNKAGESFDSDPDGNPGDIQWDDSSFSITVSGTIYTGHGSGPNCLGASNAVTVTINGATSFTGSCVAGVYSIPNVTFTGDPIITVFINNGTGKATTVTRTATGNITGLDLYQNAIILRSESVDPVTIANLVTSNDFSDDNDIMFTASASTLTVKPENELYIWRSETFAPGGDVVLQSGGSGDSRDGRLYMATSSTFTEVGTQALTLGGSLFLDSGATFTAANATTTFTATTTGKFIQATSSLTLYNVVFNGAGGQWIVNSPAGATTTMNTLTMATGTLAGTGDVVVSTLGVTGQGTISMTGGEFRKDGTGTFAGPNVWTFNNLTFGSGSAASTTKIGSATTTVSGILKIASNSILNAASSTWALTGGGTPFVITGTFNVMSAPFKYTSTSATNITATTYANLILVPSGAGTPTYTFQSSTFNATNLTIGDGTNPVRADVNANGPSVVLTGSMLISAGATYVASPIGAFQVGGSWTNNGTFTHSLGTVTFNATAAGNTITASTSPFYDLTFNSASGGWTILSNATSSHNTTITTASSFTMTSGKTLEVDGTFTNSVLDTATTWTGSTLYLRGGGTYSLNTKGPSTDVYGTLLIGTSTKISMWNSSSTVATVDPTAFLYSQNHASSSGKLYIWGAYSRSSGSEEWSAATDFDGTSLGTPRRVDVRIASSSSITISSGIFDIIGTSTASTTIQAQGGVGKYALAVSGGTLNANYYLIRDTDANGLNITGTPTVTSLSYGDFLLTYNGGTTMTVADTVINANTFLTPLNVQFATTSVLSSGSNVKATGVSATSYWKFSQSYGNFDGEAFDNDTGDPGDIRWDDSNGTIVISGHVYNSDTGTTPGAACNGITQVVRLKVQGAGSYTSSCNSTTTGAYSIPGVSYNPGDVLTLYLDNASVKAANITVDPNSNISDMDLYDNRVIVRNEDVSPMTIIKMATYDADSDSDIPFNAITGGTNNLYVSTSTKLLIWTGKTFTPGGNVTLQSGGSTVASAYDGSLEIQAGGTFTAAGSQSHSIGGNLAVDTGGTFVPANSTLTFTATTTGKTITTATSTFYNVVFNGGGGNWAFSAPATSTNDFTITKGTVTFPTGTLYIGGSFTNSGTTGGVVMHNNGTVVLNSAASGKTIQVATSSLYNLTTKGTGGWTFLDTSATTTNNFTITQGSTTLPSIMFTVGGSFVNSDTFYNNNGTVKMTSTATGKTLTEGMQSFYNLIFNGTGGTWSWTDSVASTTRNLTFQAGTTTLPSGTLNVGANFIVNNGTGAFSSNNGVVKFVATTTGFSITTASSTFYDLLFDAPAGGWTITGSATSTHDTTITNAASLTLTAGKSLEVDGTFTNSVGGAATVFTGTTLFLNSGTSYAMNAKTNSGVTYSTILLGASTKVSMWNSSAATTTTGTSASLYSQDHGNVDGKLYIYGTYTRSSGTDYWSDATDFDGTALGGSARKVDVYIATSSSLTFSGGTLNIVGIPTASTTIQASGTTGYAFTISGGTLNANYYQLRNLNSSGLNISGTPTITSLSYGDFQLAVDGGTMITVTNAAIDANASLISTGDVFALGGGVSSGFNVTRVGTSTAPWYFTGHYGNRAGEAYDSGDMSNACGLIRWDDSVCLLTTQEHYRWRNDDGGEGVPTTDWYIASLTKRKKIAISNANTTAYTNIPVKMDVVYDADMQSDFDDLRFIDSSGNLLSYWVESTVASASSTVWVKIPSLPASGSANIYMYYGDAATSSISNGTATFSFFDDFEDNNITEYSGADASLFSTGATFNHNWTYGLSASVGNTGAKTTNGGIYRTGSLLTSSSPGETIQFYQYMDAGQSDEPCALFGVQAASQNYAVCLDSSPLDRIKIVKNVTSDDDSGTFMASSTVTGGWVDGWYLVKVDWRPTNPEINVNVYNSANTLVGTVSTTTTLYTSGGMGFTFWGMNGGWDFYSAKQYTATTPTYVFGLEQSSGGATWKAAEDTSWTTSTIGDIIRLRFNIQNTANSVWNQLFRLQVAPKGGASTCESVVDTDYNDVPKWTPNNACGSGIACMATSTQYSDGDATAGLLTYPANMAFSAGHLIEDPSNTTASTTIASIAASEVEYAFKLTSNATQNAYCFRVGETNRALFDLDGYTHVAELDIQYPPAISNLTLNNASNIVLTEGTSTYIYVTATTTDGNGYGDVIYATSTVYLSSVSGGPDCAANTNNCYQIASTSCAFSSCSGNVCTVSCRADMQYYSEPTDASTTATWLARISVQDSTGFRDTETVSPNVVEVQTLRALSVTTGGINYGTLAVGADTGAVNALTTTRNTGNSNIDVQVAGASGGGIPIATQKYATSTFTYASCSICNSLTGASNKAGVNVAKPTSTSTAVTQNIYFGISIPNGTPAGTLTGTNDFSAVAPGG